MNKFRPDRLLPNKRNGKICCAMLVAALAFAGVRNVHAQEPSRERFVPADQLQSIFERTPRGIMLQRDKFEDLLKRAQDARENRSDLPTDVVVRSASYSVAKEGTHAIVDATFEIEQFLDRWVTVAIPIGNLQVEDAKIGDEVAAVGVDPSKQGLLTVVHREPGRFELRLRLSTPLGTVGSDRLAAIRLMSGVASTINVACPAERQLEVNDLKLSRPAPLEDAANYVVPAGSQKEVRLKWTARREKTEMQTLIFARSDAHVQLSADTLRWNSTTRVSVYGNSVNQLVARVPASLEITSIESSGLESWKLEDDAEKNGFTRVVLNYRQPFSDDRLVKVAAVAAMKAEEASSVPTFEFLEVTSHTGRLFVSHEQQLRLLAKVEDGVRHLGTNVQSSAGPAGEVFDFWLQEYGLDVSVRSRDRELFAQLNSSLSIVDTTASFSCEATVETLNAPLFELPVNVPDGWQIGNVTGDKNVALKWRVGSNRDQIIVEPPQAVPAGGLLNVTVHMTKTIEDPSTQQVLNIPVITIADALTVGGTYGVSAAQDLTVAPLQIVGLAPIGDDEGMLLFEMQASAWSGKVSIDRKPTRLASRSLIRSWMDLRQKTTDATVTVDILNGTLRTLTVSLSEDLGEDVRFFVTSIDAVPGVADQQVPSTVAITEQTPLDVVDGRRPFQLTFDKRFSGALTLTAFIQQPRTDASQLTASSIAVDGAIRQHGLLVFEAYPEQQLDAAKPDDSDQSSAELKIADAGLVDPPAAATGRRTALVYRFIQPDYSLDITETRFETETVPSAVCEQIANISVLSEAGTIQRSCAASFRSIGVQTLRFSLPNADQSFLWSTILNGDAVEVRRDGDDYLVAIPPASEQTDHYLEVLFETAGMDASVLGETTQESLQLAIDTDTGTATIDVLEQTWEVRYPSSSMLVNHGGGFRPTGRLEQPGWLRSGMETLSIPKLSDSPGRLFPAAVILLVIFIPTVLVLRRRWKSLAALCVLGFLILPMSLLFLGTQMSPDSEMAMTGGVEATWEVNDEYAEAGGEMMDDMFGNGEFESAYESPPLADSPFSEEAPTAKSESSSPAGAGRPSRSSRSSRETVTRNGQSQSGPMTGNDLFGGRSGGGGGSIGGFGGGIQTDNGVAIVDLSRQAPLPQGQMGGAGFGIANNAEPQAAAGGQVIVPQMPVPQAAEAFRGENLGDAENPTVISGLGDFGGEEYQKRSGTARLSIRAQIASPDDFRSMQFRSIGGTTDAGILQVVVQKRSILNAVRIIAAGLVVLFCVALNQSSIIRKVGLVIVIMAATIAAVPLLPNHQQSVLDGIAVGLAIGFTLWLLSGLKSCISQCWSCFRTRGCCGFGKSKQVVTTAMVVVAAVISSSSSSAAPQDGDDEELRPDVILPYAADRPQLLADRVFLPKDEFLKLYAEAFPDKLQSTGTPQSNAVVAAFYDSTDLTQIDDGDWSQAFRARYVIRTYDSRPTVVTLPIGAVAVRSAKLNGSDAVLLGREQAQIQQRRQQKAVQTTQQAEVQAPAQSRSPSVNAGDFSVRIPDAGLHVLDVTFEVPANIDGSVGRIALPLRPVAVGTVKVKLPEQNLEPRVNGRSNTFRRTDDEIIIPAANVNGLRIDWQPKIGQTDSDNIFHANLRSALTIDDDGLTVRSSIAINCRQGGLSEIDVAIPDDYAVRSVTGPEIAGWNLSEGDQRTLRLMFREPVEKETVVELELYQRDIFTAEEKQLNVPIPSVTGASRDSGHVTVVAGRELEVRAHSLSGVGQINAAESSLPTGMDKGVRRVLAWRYTRHPASVAIRVFRTTDRMNVTVLNGVQLESQRQLWTSKIEARISGSPRRRLEISIPGDFLVLDVAANGLADWYVSDETADSKLLNLQFAAAKTGAVAAVIQGQRGQSGNNDAEEIVVPIVNGADKAHTEVSVWLDNASKYDGATAPEWKRVTNNSALNPLIKKLKPTEPEVSFTNESLAAKPISLRLGQKQVRLTAESVYVTNVTDTSVELTLGLKWKIDSAVREVSFTLPEDLSNVFDFKIPGLRQLEIGPSVDGRVNHIVHLQQSVTGSLFILGTGTTPLPESRQVSAQPPEFTVPPDSNASQGPQSHFWVIVNQSAGLLEPVNAATDGDDVTLGDITLPGGFLEQSVAIRRLRSGKPTSAWQLKSPTQEKVSPAVIALAEHTTIIADDGTWRSHHSLQVRNESRQFIPIRIPDGSRILFCLVKDRPTRVVTRTSNDQKLHLIPVPQSGEVAAPFNVRFALSGSISYRRPGISATSIGIPAPEFPEYRDDPEYGITVSRNTWSVYVPESWTATRSSNPRDTNVVGAETEDFEDATLLAFVDNTKSMVNSLKAAKSNPNITSLYSDLQIQESFLMDNRGNTIQAESQREEALQELQILKGQLAGELQANTIDGVVNAPIGNNKYLLEFDATNNDFNYSNNADLYFSNGGVGQIDTNDVTSSGGFNFVLPQLTEGKEVERGKAKISDFESRVQTATPQKKSAPKPQFAPDNRSKLIEGRDANRKVQSERFKQQLDGLKSHTIRNQASNALPDAQAGDMLIDALVSPSIQFPEPVARVEYVDGQDRAGAAQTGEGLLSLQFQIPEDGQRFDFVRTGGNARLTLEVRSRDSIGTGLSLLWALLCIVAAAMLLKASTPGRMVNRLLILIAVIALAGWLCSPQTIQPTCLLIFAIACLCYSVSAVVRGFGRPVTG